MIENEFYENPFTVIPKRIIEIQKGIIHFDYIN